MDVKLMMMMMMMMTFSTTVSEKTNMSIVLPFKTTNHPEVFLPDAGASGRKTS